MTPFVSRVVQRYPALAVEGLGVSAEPAMGPEAGPWSFPVSVRAVVWDRSPLAGLLNCYGLVRDGIGAIRAMPPRMPKQPDVAEGPAAFVSPNFTVKPANPR